MRSENLNTVAKLLSDFDNFIENRSIVSLITIGELCLSPMGLSLVSKLSPKRIAALMMGGWFLSTAIGNKLSGVLSGLWTVFEKKEYFFLTNTLLTMLCVVALLLVLPWLNRVFRKHQEDNA